MADFSRFFPALLALLLALIPGARANGENAPPLTIANAIFLRPTARGATRRARAATTPP